MLYRENRKTVNIPICKVNQKRQNQSWNFSPSPLFIFMPLTGTWGHKADLDTPPAPPTSAHMTHKYVPDPTTPNVYLLNKQIVIIIIETL